MPEEREMIGILQSAQGSDEVKRNVFLNIDPMPLNRKGIFDSKNRRGLHSGVYIEINNGNVIFKRLERYWVSSGIEDIPSLYDDFKEVTPEQAAAYLQKRKVTSEALNKRLAKLGL